MSTPTWLEKASTELKDEVVKILNGQRVDGAFSWRLPVIALWNEYVFVNEHLFLKRVENSFEKYRLRARHGDTFATVTKQLRAEEQFRNQAHSKLSDVENCRTGSVPLPSIIRRCRYEPCGRFFLVPKNRPTRLYCDPDICGRNFRSAKSMNKRIVR